MTRHDRAYTEFVTLANTMEEYYFWIRDNHTHLDKTELLRYLDRMLARLTQLGLALDFSKETKP